MLAGQAAAVLDDHPRGGAQEVVHHPSSGVGALIERDAHVHAAGTEVSVHHAGQIVFGQKHVEVREIGGQVLGCDGGVLPATPGLDSAGQAGRQARAILAHSPERCSIGRVGDDAAFLDAAEQTERLEQTGGLVLHLGGIGSVEVDVEPGVSRRQTADGVRSAPVLHGLGDVVVDTFHCGRRELENGNHVAAAATTSS